MTDKASHASCTAAALYHNFRNEKALVYATLRQMSVELGAKTRAAVDPARWEGTSISDVGIGEKSCVLGRSDKYRFSQQPTG